MTTTTAVDVIRSNARDAYEWLETIVGDVTPEQAAWRPPGTANTIASTYAHIVINTDVDLMRHFHKREPLFARDGWVTRLALSEQAPDDWETYHDIDWPLLHEYGQEVHRQMLQLVDALTQDELDRKFQMMPVELGIWSGMDVYNLHSGRNVWMHGGEIACLKGLQGRKGYMGFLAEHLRPNETPA
jgi:hypothetical protein